MGIASGNKTKELAFAVSKFVFLLGDKEANALGFPSLVQLDDVGVVLRQKATQKHTSVNSSKSHSRRMGTRSPINVNEKPLVLFEWGCSCWIRSDALPE